MVSDAEKKIFSRVVRNAESALPRCVTNGASIVTILVGGSSNHGDAKQESHEK